MAGTLAASVLMAVAGFRTAFAADAAMYLVNALVVVPLPVLPRPDEPLEAGTVAYLGAFIWGASGAVFYTVAATTLQRLAPAKTLGRVAGVISTAESTVENVSCHWRG